MELQMVAGSVTELMSLAAVRLDPNETHRYEISPKDELSPVETIFFDMDFRKEPFDPAQYEQQPHDASHQAEMHEEEFRKQRAVSEQFESWLSDQGLASSVVQLLSSWAQSRMDSTQVGMPSLQMLMEIQRQNLPVEQAAELVAAIEQMAGLSDEHRQENQRLAELQGIAMETLSGGLGWFSSDSGMTQNEAIALYSRFKYEMGEWDAEMNRQADTLRKKVKELPIEREGSFRIVTTGSVITICQSEFDEETYKSSETCFDIDLASL